MARGFDQTFEDAAGEAFERLYREGAVNSERVLRTVEAVLDGLQRSPEAVHDRLLEVSKAMVLSAARHHRNLIEAGRALLDGSSEIGARYSLPPKEALDRILLGLAEGACQVGPIVYSRLLDVAVEYRDDAESWLRRHRRPSIQLTSEAHPIIVPIFDDLRIPMADKGTGPDKVPSPSASTVNPSSWEAALQGPEERPSASRPTSSAGWSRRPEARSLFQRFSDVLGQMFGRETNPAPESPAPNPRASQNS